MDDTKRKPFRPPKLTSLESLGQAAERLKTLADLRRKGDFDPDMVASTALPQASDSPGKISPSHRSLAASQSAS